jgi:TM2 domain-containing membrane protein YozV
MNCGARPLAGRSFCYACGAKTNELAEICVKCGVRLTEAVAKAKTTAEAEAAGISTKSRLVVTLLAWFLGVFGAHRFYLGKIGTAVTMLVLTLLAFTSFISWIWAIIDFIYAVSGNMRDKENKLIKDWQV